MTEARKTRSLVLGIGNLDRQDDGAAYHVIQALRRHLRQLLLEPDQTGLDDLGRRVDSVFLAQLAPELLDVAMDYDRLVFVDAHVQPDWEDLHCAPVEPEERPSTLTHHLTPGLFMALLQALYGCSPEAFLVSLRGYQFDFGRELSAATARLIEPALVQVLRRINPSAAQTGKRTRYTEYRV